MHACIAGISSRKRVIRKTKLIATKSSRDLGDLHPGLVRAWQWMSEEWQRVHPSLAVPFVTQTTRSGADQDVSYAQGRTAPGKVVTNAPSGESLHNYEPALAFDVAFKDKGGKIVWDSLLFQQLGQIGTKAGLQWGGAWAHGFRDMPHFEPLNYSWHKAAEGIEPEFSTII